MSMKKILAPALCLAALGCLVLGSLVAEEEEAPPEPIADGVNLLDGFEDEEPYWQPVIEEGSNSFASISVADVDRPEATEGSKMIELLCNFDAKSTMARFVTNAPLFGDWTGASEVKLDVFNPGTKPLRLSLVIQVGEKWDWNEAAPKTIKPGMNKDITFPLKGKFNNPQNNFSGFKGTPATLVPVKVVLLQVHSTSKGECTLYADNLRVIR